MSPMEIAKSAYAAFEAGDIESVLSLLSPSVEWTETAGYRYGGVFRGPQAVLQNVFTKLPEAFESFSVEIDRLLDARDVIVMQGHYVATGKATGQSVRAAVAHVIQVSDGKIVRFDQYLDSATINAIIG